MTFQAHCPCENQIIIDGFRSTAAFGSAGRRSKRRPDRQKLIIILVGLPGRGKTFLCNKLICYLNWCAGAAARAGMTAAPMYATCGLVGHLSEGSGPRWRGGMLSFADDWYERQHASGSGSTTVWVAEQGAAAIKHALLLQSTKAHGDTPAHVHCRLGHDTRHFNVGQYRRKQRGDDELQDASFFDHKNPVRQRLALCGVSLHLLIKLLWSATLMKCYSQMS